MNHRFFGAAVYVLGVTHDAIERCAQVVRHRGHEALDMLLLIFATEHVQDHQCNLLLVDRGKRVFRGPGGAQRDGSCQVFR